MEDLQSYILGEEKQLLEFNSAEELRRIALHMAQQAGRELCILTRDLDPAVYDNSDFEEALARLARSGGHVQIKILVQDSDKAVKYGHRLIGLAQRMSSKIQINRPGEMYADCNEAFLLADTSGYIKRGLADRYEGVCSFNDRLTTREMTGFFQEMWEHSEPDPNVRRLNI